MRLEFYILIFSLGWISCYLKFRYSRADILVNIFYEWWGWKGWKIIAKFLNFGWSFFCWIFVTFQVVSLSVLLFLMQKLVKTYQTSILSTLEFQQCYIQQCVWWHTGWFLLTFRFYSSAKQCVITLDSLVLKINLFIVMIYSKVTYGWPPYVYMHHNVVWWCFPPPFIPWQVYKAGVLYRRLNDERC